MEDSVSTLSVLILTKNEEENMTAVIGSARQCTSDIIVVDAGSTDGTVAMAKACGARVIYHEWENDFAKQRNIARDSSTADWILYLDADERIDVKLAEEIRQVVEADDQSKQYGMKRKSVAFGKKFTYGVLYPDTVMRLFPRQSVVWVNKVHERPDCVLTAKSYPDTWNTIRTKIGNSGRKNFVFIRRLGLKMPLKMVKRSVRAEYWGMLWAVFSKCLC